MKIAGIIAEYNPFHSGHAYHIRQTRELTGCDYVIVCMSGCFTQRGEPACLPVRERAKAALMNGADAVLELPAMWAVRTADAFARGGTAILGRLGCDVLSFGSETDDISLIKQLAELRNNEPESVSAMIREALKRGESHARARGKAIAAELGIDPEILKAPNLALAVEYTRAISSLGLHMDILPVLRNTGYHDGALGKFASAEAIRKGFAEGSNDVLKYLPQNEAEAFSAVKMHSPDDILLYRLRSMSEAEIAALPDIGEGLEKRVQRAARECGSREALIAGIKCKRYTYARISRLCTHALFGLTQEMTNTHPVPEYARLIGARRDALPLLKELSKRTQIRLVSDTEPLKNDPVFHLESRVYDIYSLLQNTNRQAGRIFTEKFLMI